MRRPVSDGMRREAQADLSVIRARAGLMRARTALVNAARGLAKSYGERLGGCNVRNMHPEKAEGQARLSFRFVVSLDQERLGRRSGERCT